jgi:hypothetical protein
MIPGPVQVLRLSLLVTVVPAARSSPGGRCATLHAQAVCSALILKLSLAREGRSSDRRPPEGALFEPGSAGPSAGGGLGTSSLGVAKLNQLQRTRVHPLGPGPPGLLTGRLFRPQGCRRGRCSSLDPQEGRQWASTVAVNR